MDNWFISNKYKEIAKKSNIISGAKQPEITRSFAQVGLDILVIYQCGTPHGTSGGNYCIRFNKLRVYLKSQFVFRSDLLTIKK